MMKIWPVFLDFVPPYLARSAGSLLQTPMGRALLVSTWCDRVKAVTANRPVILPPPMSGPRYRASLSVSCPEAIVLSEAEQLIDSLLSLETSDVLLFIDARYFPVYDSAIAGLVDEFSHRRQIPHHLVAFEASICGTKEHVDIDGAGQVRRIDRYYEPATWPFLAGVAASLVPVSSGLRHMDRIPESLVALRQQLAVGGAASRDVGVEGVALDLIHRHGLLAAMEHCVREEVDRARAAGRPATVLVGEGHSIARTARILGPVVIHPDVCIGEHATVVGPALIGAGARVSSGAVVAHAIVGPNSQVPRDRTLRDRIWFNDLDDRSHERPGASYRARLERFSCLPNAASAIDAVADVSHPWHLAWKRRFDIVAAFLGLVFLSPLFLLVAALIRFESRGSILYRAIREGWQGRRFNCLKFRTMQEGAHDLQHVLKAQDKLDGPHFKLDHDPRVTRLGRILRLTNIDELPQLINVLRGEMSLVGPRPSPFRENQICVPWRKGRLSVRPGVTGLWQVCRHDRSAGDFHQWIEYDLLYVQQASPWLDLKILLATMITLTFRVPVPASWLVRLPPPLRRVSEAGVGKSAQTVPPPPAATGPAPVTSRTA